MASGGGGGGLFGNIQNFLINAMSPETSMAQEELQNLSASNEVKRAQNAMAERDRQDKAMKLRDEDRAKQKAAAAMGQGRGSTILTSPLGAGNSLGGVGETSMTGGKTLLGS